ncbi:MAG: hypothetical protein ABL927_00975 [Bdellovibrionales bacterium]
MKFCDAYSLKRKVNKSNSFVSLRLKYISQRLTLGLLLVLYVLITASCSPGGNQFTITPKNPNPSSKSVYISNICEGSLSSGAVSTNFSSSISFAGGNMRTKSASAGYFLVSGIGID